MRSSVQLGWSAGNHVIDCVALFRRAMYGSALVAPAGFEPAISALRGLRPRPLDDGAARNGRRGLTRASTLPEAKFGRLGWWAALGLNQ